GHRQGDRRREPRPPRSAGDDGPSRPRCARARRRRPVRRARRVQRAGLPVGPAELRAPRPVRGTSSPAERAGSPVTVGAAVPDSFDDRVARDPQWYKRAVFYEVLVRAFADSDGDGTGDLRGLTNKLDYLAWLGVDCLWLPPFFASPLRDGGYDVAHFTEVLPEFGTLGDFVEFVDAAHERGMRVIIDFV